MSKVRSNPQGLNPPTQVLKSLQPFIVTISVHGRLSNTQFLSIFWVLYIFSQLSLTLSYYFLLFPTISYYFLLFKRGPGLSEVPRKIFIPSSIDPFYGLARHGS